MGRKHKFCACHLCYIKKSVDFTKARKHRVRQIFRGMTGCAVYHPSDQVPPSRWQISHLYIPLPVTGQFTKVSPTLIPMLIW